MAEPSNSAAASGPTPSAAPASAPKPPNPAFKMLGMPNLRFKLPSRNWMIFFTITGSFTAALMYDRKEKRRAQQKWCDLVAHLSKESLPVEQMRRKITVFLSAPPGDGLRSAREHFKEYVKPILVAAALDYQVIEGRREGDIRAAFAERIRKSRRKAGEPSTVVEETSTEDVVTNARIQIGVTDEPGPKGDLVIGRHTWKEYIRGLHEGWLGPLDPPPPPPPAEEFSSPDTGISADGSPITEEPKTEDTKTEDTASEEKKKEEEEKKKPAKPVGPTPAYLSTTDYSSQPLPPTFPQTLDGSVPIPLPHLLGFLNTPIRLYRYLNQRHVAENVGRDVAGMVLASYSRPYHEGSISEFTADDSSPTSTSPSDDQTPSSATYEQQTVLEAEEPEWHKSVHKKDESNPDREREWLNDIVLDPRFASRMHRYALSPEEEARAQRITEGQEYILGEERPAPVPFWQHMWIKYGYGEDAETLKRKPILGNIDGEDDV
ncbi:import inner membrane translocase subunit tim54 [Aspergillus heteromorphus CBS 117.55]|uniref:Mitochondrial import inner membrane translocase subunit TIM54 n=1 Tax=Aspergillus heteromorphus CBS 117.55 TaxID=1448321 RepID=A0A317W6G6_9EURO|nr:import inner membrane translocase subunit tim54 [Aspergillus heteromorphus CBS 117.55]PWY80598.1 import inner membrane translocase subunit tim54 [Aspergillus heteromorphus CBS 117.55]